jgi:hypothetical protein
MVATQFLVRLRQLAELPHFVHLLLAVLVAMENWEGQLPHRQILAAQAYTGAAPVAVEVPNLPDLHCMVALELQHLLAV